MSEYAASDTAAQRETDAKAAGEGVQKRKEQKQQAEAMHELSQGFVDKFGFEVIVKPDSAGRAIYGKDKFTLELRIPQPEEASAVGDAGVTFLDPYTVSYNEDGDGQILSTTASYMHKSRVTADTQTITALNTAFALASNTHAWIEIAVTSVAPTAAELKTGTAFPALIVTAGSPAAQTKYNLPVGRVVADSQPGMPGFDFSISTTAYHWQQLLRNHQLLKVECFNGTPVLVSTDWQGI